MKGFSWFSLAGLSGYSDGVEDDDDVGGIDIDAVGDVALDDFDDVGDAGDVGDVDVDVDIVGDVDVDDVYNVDDVDDDVVGGVDTDDSAGSSRLSWCK